MDKDFVEKILALLKEYPDESDKQLAIRMIP